MQNKFLHLAELGNLVLVRNHLLTILDTTRNFIKKGDSGKITTVVRMIDQQILDTAFEALDSPDAQIISEDQIAAKVAAAKAALKKTATQSDKVDGAVNALTTAAIAVGTAAKHMAEVDATSSPTVIVESPLPVDEKPKAKPKKTFTRVEQ